jgi:hypothetical protein
MSGCGRLQFFPTCFPDESLFSLIARYHRLSGHHDDRDTLHELFGKHTQIVSSHLPSLLDTLASRLPQAMALDAQDIVDRHTLFPYFRPFLTERQVALSLVAMKGSSASGLKTLMGLIASQVGGGNCYRYCEQCSERDVELVGQPYWHRAHQLPAVHICAQHGTPLVELAASWVAQHRHQLFLPADREVILHAKHVFVAAQHREGMLALSILSRQVLNLHLDIISARRLQEFYRTLASNLGFTHAGGRVMVAELSQRVRQQMSSLSANGAMQCLQRPASGPQDWAISLLRKSRKSSHPLKHLVLLQCLNGKIEHLLMAVNETIKISRPSSRPKPPLVAALPGNQLRTMLVDHQYSLRRCAQLLGKSVTTLRIEAAQGGIPVAKRPKKLDGPTMAILTMALQSNTSLETLARRHQTSTVSLYRLLRMFPDVAKIRKELIFVNQRDRRRRRFVGGHPTVLLRARPDYAWLHKNDREWLTQTIETTPRWLIVHTARIDWGRRDQEMADAVRECSQELYAAEKPVRVSQSAIGRKIGCLAVLEKHLIKLPLTAVALAACVETTAQFQCRRLSWAARQILYQQGVTPAGQLIYMARLRPPLAKEVELLLNRLVNQY